MVIHVLLLCDEFPPASHGGIGVSRYHIAHGLRKLGHRVTVVGLYHNVCRRTDSDENGIRVIRLPAGKLPLLRVLVRTRLLALEIKRLHSEHAIDIIDGPESSFALLPGQLPRPWVIRMHGGHHFFYTSLGKSPRPVRSWLEKRSFSKVDALCAVSHFVAQETRDLLKLEHMDITVIPNPVNTELFRPHPEIAEEDGLIVFVGTLTEKKGLIQLIEAMTDVCTSVPSAHLLIIGRDTRERRTGKSFQEKLTLMIPKDIQGRIRFQNVVPNVELPLHIARAQVCVFPSHMESMGRVVIESMAMAKATVASQLGPGPELIDNGQTGLLCDPYDPADISRHLIRLLRDRALRLDLSRRAREAILKRFSESTISLLNESFYSRLIDHKIR